MGVLCVIKQHWGVRLTLAYQLAEVWINHLPPFGCKWLWPYRPLPYGGEWCGLSIMAPTTHSNTFRSDCTTDGRGGGWCAWLPLTQEEEVGQGWPCEGGLRLLSPQCYQKDIANHLQDAARATRRRRSMLKAWIYCKRHTSWCCPAHSVSGYQ